MFPVSFRRYPPVSSNLVKTTYSNVVMLSLTVKSESNLFEVLPQFLMLAWDITRDD